VPRRSLVIAALSTVVEWYDFTLYLYLATVMSRVFFGGGADSLVVTLAVFAIAYVMRPLGALVFGRFGDRAGRRTVLLISMTMMAAAMLATACLPTHAQAGPVAAWLLLLLRCVMGFSVGGEYSGVLTYLVESAPRGRRGLVASIAAAGSEIGALLAVGVATLTVTLTTTAQMDSWGWRIPFAFGAALAITTLIARSSMRESPEFSRPVSRPARGSAWRVLTQERAAVRRTFMISALGSVTYYVGVTYVPSYLVAVQHFAEGSSLSLSTIASVAIIVVTPPAGLLSDRVGRRPMLLLFCLLSAVLSLPMFALMGVGGVGGAGFALTGAVVLAVLAGGVSAVAASASPEQFPTSGRLTGLAWGNALATAIFGGLTPYASQELIQASGWKLAPGLLVAVIAAAAFPALWSMPETAFARPAPAPVPASAPPMAVTVRVPQQRRAYEPRSRRRAPDRSRARPPGRP
jgi:MHS family proline/betaine transporter-like MFS transporter